MGGRLPGVWPAFFIEEKYSEKARGMGLFINGKYSGPRVLQNSETAAAQA
jgi:hypothetical protein